jgi:exopolysaccharide production protein ExoZ
MTLCDNKRADHRSVESSQGVIRPVQYLRGLAALMVVWYHGMGQIPAVERLLGRQVGATGVDLFFVISGFIMLVTTAGKSMGPLEFMVRRLVRVVPLYWLTTAALLVSVSVVPELFKSVRFTTTSVVLSLLFIPQYSLSLPDQIWPVLVPGWTLNYEMFFYALFAVSLLLPQRMRVPALGATFGLLVVIGIGIGPFASALATVYTNPMLLEFAAGAIVGQLWLAGALRMPLGLATLLIVGGFVLLALGAQPPAMSYLALIGGALMVAGCVHARLRASNIPLFLALGDASYSIYLTHLFALGALRSVWIRISPDPNMASAIAFMVAALVLAAACGYACYRLIEKPVTSVLHGWTRGLRSQRAPKREELAAGS